MITLVGEVTHRFDDQIALTPFDKEDGGDW